MTAIQCITADVLTLDADMFAGAHTLIVDPPYGDHVHQNAVSAGTLGAGSRGYHQRDLGFAALTPELRARIAAIGQRCARWSVVFSDHEGTHEWRRAFERESLVYIREIPEIDPEPEAFELPWVRWSQPQKSGDRPGSQSEAVLHWHQAGAKRWNGPGSLTHYARRAMRGQDKHPTEKPIDLLLDMVSWFSDPGETVVDVCAGAGTTAVAAQLLGRSCIAIEVDPQWAPKAKWRLETLTPRDQVRAAEWCESTTAEVARVPTPRAADGSDVKTWERGQRRLADVARVAAWLT